MHKETEVIIVIVSGTIILLSLSILVILFTVKHRRNILQHKTELLKAELEIQEQTFNTISREIHDNVGQILSLAKVQLNIIDQGDTLNKELLADAKDSVSKALGDLRDIAKSLNTERIQLSSLPEIIVHEVQRLNRAGLIHVSFHCEGKVQNIQDQKKLIAFRIIQEALQNILKHSKAKNVDMLFQYGPDHLTIIIQDNGIGFDKELLSKKDGLGLENIVNRASMINGKAEITSTINKGTTITITSPYA